jgi:type II secretory pathway predicted ATPase ExeA
MLDLAAFGLTRRPFRPTPDTTAYFPSATHEAAVAALRDAHESAEGIALLDGAAGVGKTLVAMRFLETLPPEVPRVIVPGVRYARPSDLYQAVLFDLGAPFQGLGEQELRLAVADRLLGSLAAGHPTVVVLDEAQHLGSDLLEEVRLLGNLETRSAKAAFVVMVASPVLRDRLPQAVAQRIAARPRIEPLSAAESTQFLGHQIHTCGGDPAELVTDEALALLALRCGGVPRVLNQAANLALTLTAAAGETAVDCEATLEALGRLGLSTDVEDAEPPKPAVKPRPPKRRSA